MKHDSQDCPKPLPRHVSDLELFRAILSRNGLGLWYHGEDSAFLQGGNISPVEAKDVSH